MITLTRLNGQTFLLNPELIETVEEKNNTLITLTSGNRYMVRESAKTTVKKIRQYYKALKSGKKMAK